MWSEQFFYPFEIPNQLVFWLNTLTGTTISLMEVILDLSTLRSTKPQILTPKRRGDHPPRLFVEGKINILANDFLGTLIEINREEMTFLVLLWVGGPQFWLNRIVLGGLSTWSCFHLFNIYMPDLTSDIWGWVGFLCLFDFSSLYWLLFV